jgi:CPA2 family monovalent cation:H+ antiporter-2
VGLADLFLNALPGVACALLLGWGAPAAVALGGVTYVTSSGITAQLLTDLGWAQRPEGRVVVSLLVLEDLTMAAYLPILTTLLAGASLLAGSRTLAIAAAAIALILFISLRHGRLVETFVSSPSEEVLLLKVLGLTLLVAGIAEKIQVSAAVAPSWSASRCPARSLTPPVSASHRCARSSPPSSSCSSASRPALSLSCRPPARP